MPQQNQSVTPKKPWQRIISLILALLVIATVLVSVVMSVKNKNEQAQELKKQQGQTTQTTTQRSTQSDILATPDVTIPGYTGKPSALLNHGQPYFDSKKPGESKSLQIMPGYQNYTDLDKLGRCGTATACLGPETMPTQPRGRIGMIKPSGWHTIRYDGIIHDKYLYNRCHLIGYQLSGQNANPKNLITGTRYLNVEGMLPYENEVADYIKASGNHVMYRVTPVFQGKDLVARGVIMEAESLEDQGQGIRFCVFCYNVQPGITIDYSDGSSHAN